MRFHGGLTKKQFLTLGYTHLVNKRGMAPTCRNIINTMEEHGAITSKKSGSYQTMRSTIQSLELQHKVVNGKQLGAMFGPLNSKPPYGFYPTDKGMDILKTYMEEG